MIILGSIFLLYHNYKVDPPNVQGLLKLIYIDTSGNAMVELKNEGSQFGQCTIICIIGT